MTPKYALSVRQPWAWAIIHAGKDVENRNNEMLCHRGVTLRELAIHASKGMTQKEYIYAREFMRGLNVDCPPPDRLHRGCVIGSVECLGVTDRRASDWFFGPYAITLSNPTTCTPIPATGQLGFFKWTESGKIDPPKPWMQRAELEAMANSCNGGE